MADDIQQLPPSDEPMLEAGEGDKALPAGGVSASLPASTEPDSESSDDDYAVLVNDPDTGDEQVAVAEQFGEELIALRAIVQRYADQMDTLKNEIKVQRESFGNLLDNDEELQNLEEQAKTVTQDVKTKKQRLKESPEAVQIQMKVKELQEELKEIQEALNNHLLRYYQMTGSKVIEDEEGQERTISLSARLSRKKGSE